MQADKLCFGTHNFQKDNLRASINITIYVYTAIHISILFKSAVFLAFV